MEIQPGSPCCSPSFNVPGVIAVNGCKLYDNAKVIFGSYITTDICSVTTTFYDGGKIESFVKSNFTAVSFMIKRLMAKYIARNIHH